MKGDAFHNATFRAFFVDGKNIAKIPVLVELAASVDLPSEEAREVIAARTFKDAVDEHWSISRQKSITAVPTFVINQEKLVGAQPYEMLKKLLEINRAKKRDPFAQNKIISFRNEKKKSME